jgi:hypothetical protein
MENLVLTVCFAYKMHSVTKKNTLMILNDVYQYSEYLKNHVKQCIELIFENGKQINNNVIVDYDLEDYGHYPNRQTYKNPIPMYDKIKDKNIFNNRLLTNCDFSKFKNYKSYMFIFETICLFHR